MTEVPADHVQRTRAAYSESAAQQLDLIGSSISDLVEADADIELLARFADSAREVGGGALDAGCGTGRVARLLADHGLDAVGVDIAEGMVEIARREHPDLGFAIAELARLPFPAGTFAATAYWYSIITTPPTELGPVVAELARVLATGGVALVAFQAGDGSPAERPDAYGSGVDLTLYRHDASVVATVLEGAGLGVVEVIERAPERPHEATDQAFILARAPVRQSTA